MRRIGLWVSGIGCLGVALTFVLMTHTEAAWGKKDAPKTEAPPAMQKNPGQTLPATPGAAGAATGQTEQEKIVYTFDDDTKLQEFANLWRQRQGIILRMNVLQSYFGEEQAALAQLNSKFSATYHLDVTKNYSLDDKRRVLIEREAPPAPPAAAANLPMSNPPVQKP